MNVVVLVASALVAIFPLNDAECGKNLTDFCPLCCAILYSNRDCHLQPREFRLIKNRADGFLGIIWEDKARMVEVGENCLLQAWDLRNQTGASRALGMDGRRFHDLNHYAFSMRISSLKCHCVGS